MSSTIDISSSKDYQVREKTNVNDQGIIQLVIDDCHTYFYDENYEYIVLLRKIGNTKFYNYTLIKIRGELNEDDPIYLELLENINNDSKRNSIIKSKQNKIKKIDVDGLLKNPHKSCSKRLDLTLAREMLDTLNVLIREKGGCEDLRLNLDYIYDMTGDVALFSEPAYNNSPTELILCLYYKNVCVSSIEILRSKQEDMLEINSKTFKEYEGRKYNKLLRAVAIMIAKKLLPHCSRVASDAQNKISAILLLFSFKGHLPHNDKNDDYYRFIEKKYPGQEPKITPNILEDFYKLGYELNVEVELTSKNIQNATKQFTIVKDTMNARCITERKRTSAAKRIQRTIRTRLRPIVRRRTRSKTPGRSTSRGRSTRRTGSKSPGRSTSRGRSTRRTTSRGRSLSVKK